MMPRLFMLLLVVSFAFIPVTAYGHTIDAVGEYRVEIGWMNEPVVSMETNAVEFYVNPLVPCPKISEPNKCAESQEFRNGVPGLNKTIKIKLILKDESITLSLAPDHNIPGKYYAFVNPTVSGFYQANILGTIVDTPISLSMHPPKVAERSYIEFPHPSDITVQQMIKGQTSLIKDVSVLKESVKAIKNMPSNDIGYAGIAVGMIGIVIAIYAVIKPRTLTVT